MKLSQIHHYKSLGLFLVSLAIIPGANAAPITFHDDFSAYAPGSDPQPAWDTDSIGWAAGDHKLEVRGAERSFAVYTRAPRAREVSVETVLNISAGLGENWKVAGVALFDNDANYWHLALIESPQKTHSVELQESLAGTWLAATNAPTKLTPFQNTNFSWDFNHPYRLRLDIGKDTITGVITEIDGTVRARLGYRLDNQAVKVGQPALDSSGFQAAFSSFSATVNQPAPSDKVTGPAIPPFRATGYGSLHGKTTGYFHVEKIHGRWWLINPRGEAFFAVGTDHVNYNVHFSEKLGYAPYHRSVEQKYHSEAAWASETTRRLRAWNFNALGLGWSPGMKDQGLPRDEFVGFGTSFAALDDITPRTTWTGFPNVFSKDWPLFCDKLARRICRPQQNDPWIIGYFLDNELEWFGKDHQQWGLFDECMKKPAGHSAKTALLVFLKARYPSIERFNTTWGTHFADWSALDASTEVLNPASSQALADRMAFVRLIADRYFSVPAAALKKWAPHHLNLGCRFAAFAPDGVIGVAGRYCDVVSVNYYGVVDLDRNICSDMPALFKSDFEECQRPMMITEWSFLAYDSGLPCLHGAGQRLATQAERARCFEIYQTDLFHLPFLVGSNYFMWVDEPAEGISSSFPEDSNYGLVDKNDRPWKDVTIAATRINARVYPIHSGRTPEIAVTIAANGRSALLRNSGGAGATVPVQIWVDGKLYSITQSVAAGSQSAVLIKVPDAPGGHLVAVIADPQGTLGETDRSDNAAIRLVYIPGAGWQSREKASYRIPLVVSNPTGQLTTHTVFVQTIDSLMKPSHNPSLKQGFRQSPRSALQLYEGSSGGAVPFQIDGSGEDAEVVFNAGNLGPYTCRTFYLQRRSGAIQSGAAATGTSTYAETPAIHTTADGFEIQTGKLVLRHEKNSGDLFSRVSAGDLPLGQFLALIHQQGAQEQWVRANHTDTVRAYRGPVRSAVDITVSFNPPPSSPANGPRGFQACYRIAAYPGQSWFSSRLLRIKNTDKASWKLAGYFHYAVSAIGGAADHDIPARFMPPATAAWENPGLSAYYGCTAATAEEFKMQYWQDEAPPHGEHPDLWRDVNIQLAPGQVYAERQPAVFVFGARGKIEAVRAITQTARTWDQAAWASFLAEKR